MKTSSAEDVRLLAAVLQQQFARVGAHMTPRETSPNTNKSQFPLSTANRLAGEQIASA